MAIKIFVITQPLSFQIFNSKFNYLSNRFSLFHPLCVIVISPTMDDNEVESDEESINGTLAFQYVPLKKPTEAEIYEEFVKSVAIAFGKGSKKFDLFIRLIEDFKEQRITAREIESEMDELLDEPTLSTRFSEIIFPALKVSNTTDPYKAYQFIRSVERAFPDNKKRCDLIENLVLKFRDGKLSLKDLTLRMKKLLENKEEPMQAYIRFLPRSEQVLGDARGANTGIIYYMVTIVITAVAVMVAAVVALAEK